MQVRKGRRRHERLLLLHLGESRTRHNLHLVYSLHQVEQGEEAEKE